MIEQVTIKVERPTNNSQKPFVTVFERVLDFNSSISVPYANIVDCFRFVYGLGVVISVSSAVICHGTD